MYKALHALINLTYFWPQKGVDTPQQFATILGEDKAEYHRQLLLAVKSYLHYVDICVKRGYDARSRADVSHLDKPNVHRLLELYVHTVPAFGHARQVSELTFERAHQPLKRIWEQHNGKNRHYSMVREIRYDDLFMRLYVAQDLYQRSDDEAKRSLARHMSNLLFGRKFSKEQYDENFEEINNKTNNIVFLPMARRILRKQCSSKWVSSRHYPWKARVATDSLPLETRRAAIRVIFQTYLPTATSPRFFEQAHRGTNPSNRIRAGDACQVLLRDSDLEHRLIRSDGGGSDLYYFTILSIFTTNRFDVYAEVLQLEHSDDENEEDEMRAVACIQSNIKVLLLNNAVRRVATFHNCMRDQNNDRMCRYDAANGSITHSKSLLDGGAYRIFSRSQGYPPKTG